MVAAYLGIGKSKRGSDKVTEDQGKDIGELFTMFQADPSPIKLE